MHSTGVVGTPAIAGVLQFLPRLCRGSGQVAIQAKGTVLWPMPTKGIKSVDIQIVGGDGSSPRGQRKRTKRESRVQPREYS